ncbi:DnaJ-domain-containing protein [Hypoxylon sp. FL0890]|nr:DnaJ-domain-containing protein [Hypoxylon sp. FL0890]
MPSTPTFDYYAALEVERTATPQEITAAYRRLALIHHPDKNPDDMEAATEAFQNIQLAYETLVDPTQRSRYDARVSSPDSASSFRSQSMSDDDYDDDYDVDEEEQIYYRDELLGRLASAFWARYGLFTTPSPAGPSMDTPGRTLFEDNTDRSRFATELYQLRMAREEEAARLREARAAEKQAEEAAKAEEKEAALISEKSKQEARWVVMKSQTMEDKIAACLHSEFCAKMTLRHKFKCGACHVKRGITAFECPHCTAQICQLCVFEFAKKRAAAAKKPTPEPEPEPVAEPKPAQHGYDKKPDAAKSTAGRARGGNNNPRPRCYNCNKLGHMARTCRNRGAGQANSAAGPSNANANAGARGQGKGKGKAKAQ